MIKNLNRVIGPSSLEILSYLRIAGEDDLEDYYECNEEEEEQDHLYVIPTNIFNEFELYFQQILDSNSNEDQHTLERIKPYRNFFHRALF